MNIKKLQELYLLGDIDYARYETAFKRASEHSDNANICFGLSGFLASVSVIFHYESNNSFAFGFAIFAVTFFIISMLQFQSKSYYEKVKLMYLIQKQNK